MLCSCSMISKQNEKFREFCIALSVVIEKVLSSRTNFCQNKSKELLALLVVLEVLLSSCTTNFEPNQLFRV